MTMKEATSHYYTPKFGLFADIQIKVRRQIGDYSTEIKALTSDLVTFKFVQNLPSVRETVVLPEETLNGKNPDVAKSWREKGNEQFAKKNMKESILMYNMCLVNAPLHAEKVDSGSELALGFANRSAALYRLNLHEECLRDIKWALARGYPPKLRYKVYERQGNSFHALGRYTDASEAFNRALSLLEEAGLDTEKKTAFQLRVEKAEASCMGKSDKTSKPQTKTQPHDELNFTPATESMYPNLSSSCEVRESPEKGLYVVAKEKLKPGDVIIVERPYSWSVEPDYKHTYCHHCMSRFITPIPCPSCNVALFCNEQCMVASSKYHKYECPCLSLLMEDSIGTCTTTHLAFRVIVTTGIETILKHKNFLDEAQDQSEVDPRVRKYNMVYRLPSHSEKRNAEDILERGLIAVFLLRCLERANFFERADVLSDEMCMTIDDVKDYVGGLLLRHLQSVAIAAFSIKELQVNKGQRLDNPSQTSTVVIGGALHCATSLLGHACDDNTNVQAAKNTTTIVRALSTILPGEEVTITYGPIYFQSSLAERQAWLKRRYRFTCRCAACTENWPSMMTLLMSKATWRCQSCKKPLPKEQAVRIKCRFCNGGNDVRAMEQRLNESVMSDQVAAHNILSANYDAQKALPLFYKHLAILEALVCKPSIDLFRCQEAIRECYRVLGNFHIRD